jgi:hypothetical protein
MRTRTKITDLSRAQWDRLQLRVQTSYDIPPGIARVCAVFELAPMTERHVEMPIQAFGTLMAELAQIGQAETELAAVSLSGLPAHLEEARNAADPVRAAERKDCSFCHRERSAKDDNHADDCPYWSIGPGSVKRADQDADELLEDIREFPSQEGFDK